MTELLPEEKEEDDGSLKKLEKKDKSLIKKSKNKDQKIITDSNKQEYERGSGKFEAHGNVRVRTEDIKVIADHMKNCLRQ